MQKKNFKKIRKFNPCQVFHGRSRGKKGSVSMIKKENENLYFMSRPLEMSENLFTFLQSASFYFKRGEGYDNQIQQFKEELNLYGLLRCCNIQHNEFSWPK